ncbi:MAG TPA: hypothetical protein VH161_08075 [Candidatus Acidoferrales bacterium]|nr:hypothetical protein [Candidatus Acidoferrales bacterium]
MKSKTVLLSLLVLLMNVSSLAKVIPPRPFYLDRDVTVNGAMVPMGMYSLTVESKGSAARATLWKEGRFVATAHGTWVRHGVKYVEDAVLLRVNADGTRSLTEIRLAGSAKTIVIDGDGPIQRSAPAPNRGSGNSITGTPAQGTAPGGAGFHLWG